MQYIDINCDCGEMIPGLDDGTLMPYLSSCNIACGGHAGTLESMIYTIQAALEHRVRIGAHPGYEDRDRFGRVSLSISPGDLKASILRQLNVLKQPLMELGVPLHHVKAHGALYHDLSRNRDLGESYLEVVREFDSELAVYAMAHSNFEQLANDAGFTVIREGFADRRYLDKDSLIPRGESNAIISKRADILHQIKNMVLQNQVATRNEKTVPLTVETICIHGDHPNAMVHLSYLYQHLQDHQIKIKKY